MEKKSGLYAKNDVFIELLIKDPNYEIRECGEIWTLIEATGKRSVHNRWRKMAIHLNLTGGKIHRHEVNYQGKRLLLHRILYRKFVGKLNPNLVINHIDGNPSNNSVSNLELVTVRENNIHAFKVLGKKPNRSRAQLTDEQARELRADRLAGMTYRELMAKYKIKHKSTIFGICSGRLYPEYLLSPKAS